MKQLIFVILMPFQLLLGQVSINELMADNVHTLNDIFSDAPDWIELYNASDTAVDLLNWHLSDNPANLQVYTFPSVVLPPNGFLLLYASGRNLYLANQLHLAFKLDAEGESLILSRPNGQIEDAINYPPLGMDLAYGLLIDGGSDQVIFSSPTPGFSNLLGDTLIPQTWEIVPSSGYYPQTVSVQLQGDLPPNAVLRYTLNGDDPSPTSPVFPTSMEWNEHNLPEAELAFIPTGIGWHIPKQVQTAHILKGQVFLGDKPLGPIIHRTYFLFPEGTDAYSLPVISIQTPPENLFGNEQGIYVIGNNENYNLRGTGAEREIYLEFFDQEGQKHLGQYAGVRIYGGTSRIKPQKSLKLFARKIYGENNFSYPFFGDDYDNQFKRIVLRSLITDWGPSAMTDDLIQEIIYQEGSSNFESIRRSYAIVFLNGEYWGIHSLREDFNDEYVERKFNIDEDDVQTMNQEFFNLLDFIAQHDMREEANFQLVANQFDLDAFADYMATELFFANIDWPRLNYLFWRERGIGKWRPVFYDLDGACKVYNENMLQYIFEIERYHSPEHNEAYLLIVLGSLLENETFRQRFTLKLIERIQYSFTPDFTTEVQQTLINDLAPEMEEHIQRWSYPKSYRKWQSATDKVRDFLFMRPEWLLGLSFNLFDYPLKLYPNPIRQGESLILNMEAIAEENIAVQAISMDQKLIELGSYAISIGNNELFIATENLSPGFYVLAVQGERLYLFDKLIVR